MKREKEDLSVKDVMKNYPRITAHIIAESLGYATPSCAALILRDAIQGKENYCEWIYSCYDGNAMLAVKNAIKHRHTHRGFMAEYKIALALVRQAIKTGDEPMFGSWF